MKKFFVIISCMLGFMSCSSDDNNIVEPVDPANPLGLSVTDTIRILAPDEFVAVSVKSPGWAIEKVVVEDKEYAVDQRADVSSESDGTTVGVYDWLTVKTAGNDVKVAGSVDIDVRKGEFAVTLRKGDVRQTINGVSYLYYREGPVQGVDYIQLSADKMEFGAEGGSQTARFGSARKGIWVSQIEMGNQVYHLSNDEKRAFSEAKEFEKTYEWLTLKRSGDDLTVTLAPNVSVESRTATVRFQFMNFFAALEVTQARNG